MNIDIEAEARELEPYLRGNRREGVTDETRLVLQLLQLTEEAGELTGAYRRYAGLARRHGTREAVEDELADVLLAAAGFAVRAGIDLDSALRRKLYAIWTRGWREEDEQIPADDIRADVRQLPDGRDQVLLTCISAALTVSGTGTASSLLHAKLTAELNRKVRESREAAR